MTVKRSFQEILPFDDRARAREVFARYNLTDILFKAPKGIDTHSDRFVVWMRCEAARRMGGVYIEAEEVVEFSNEAYAEFTNNSLGLQINSEGAA